MGLTGFKKDYITSTIVSMLKEFGVKGNPEEIKNIFDKLEDMVNKQDQCELNATPSTAVADFSSLYFDLFTNMVLPYAVEYNTGINYGEKYEKYMGLIFANLPDNFVKACEKKAPTEIPEYNKLVKNAFLEKMEAYKDRAHGNTYKAVFGNNDSERTKLQELNSVTSQFARISAFYDNSCLDKNGNRIKNPESFKENKESANKMLGVVAIKYQEVKAEYNKLNFFQKYFWFTGYEYREEMDRTIDYVKKMNTKFKLFETEVPNYTHKAEAEEVFRETAERVLGEVNMIKESAENFNPRMKLEIDLGEDPEPNKDKFTEEVNPEPEKISSIN